MNKENANWKAPFFTVWIGQQISLLGSLLAGFALVWWVTQATGSATYLATLTMVYMLPGVLLGPVVGALVDRWNRRTVMIVADSVVALFSAWLAYLFWTNALTMWHVYLISLVRALGGTFHWPAMSASTSLMVPQKELTRVAGLNQTINGIWNILSPPLGALLMSLLPLHTIMGLDVLTAALAVGPLFFVFIPQPERASAAVAGRSSLWHDVKEGLRYVWNWKGLRAILLLATLINFVLAPASSLLPLLVHDHFGGDALHLGWIKAMWGAGVVAGGLVLSVWGGFKRRIVTSMLGVMGLGVGAILVGAAPATAFWMAMVGMLLLGIMNPITNGPIHAIFQSVVTPDMQGRVFTVVSSLAGAMAPLGMAIAGPLSDHFGVRAWNILGGIVCLVMGVVGYLTPAVLHIEDQSHAGGPQAVSAAQAPAAAAHAD